MDFSQIEKEIKDLDQKYVDNIKNTVNLYKTLTVTLESFIELRKRVAILEYAMRHISLDKLNVSDEELKQLKEDGARNFEKEQEINKLKRLWQLKQEAARKEGKVLKNNARKKMRRDKKAR